MLKTEMTGMQRGKKQHTSFHLLLDQQRGCHVLASLEVEHEGQIHQGGPASSIDQSCGGLAYHCTGWKDSIFPCQRFVICFINSCQD